jgi:hypothetical protein
LNFNSEITNVIRKVEGKNRDTEEFIFELEQPEEEGRRGDLLDELNLIVINQHGPGDFSKRRVEDSLNEINWGHYGINFIPSWCKLEFFDFIVIDQDYLLTKIIRVNFKPQNSRPISFTHFQIEYVEVAFYQIA